MRILPIVAKISFMWLMHAALLFGVSGVWQWPGAWLFLLFYACAILITSGLFSSLQTGLAEERWGKKAHVKSWDTILMPLAAIILPLLTVAIASFETRVNGIVTSFACHLSGLAIGALSCSVLAAAMYANRFFSTHVRIQNERGHTVVDRGPYRFVRHPGYVAMLCYAAATPLSP